MLHTQKVSGANKSAHKLTRRDRKNRLCPCPTRGSNPGSSDLNLDSLITELRPPSLHLPSRSPLPVLRAINVLSAPKHIDELTPYHQPTCDFSSPIQCPLYIQSFNQTISYSLGSGPSPTLFINFGTVFPSL